MLVPEIIIVNYLLLFLTITDFIRNTKKGSPRGAAFKIRNYLANYFEKAMLNSLASLASLFARGYPSTSVYC